MGQAFKGVLVELAGSKKFLVLVATLAALGLTKLLSLLHVTGTVTVDDVMPYLVLISGYLVAQGVADHGKEAMKQQALNELAKQQAPSNDNATRKLIAS